MHVCIYFKFIYYYTKLTRLHYLGVLLKRHLNHWNLNSYWNTQRNLNYITLWGFCICDGFIAYWLNTFLGVKKHNMTVYQAKISKAEVLQNMSHTFLLLCSTHNYLFLPYNELLFIFGLKHFLLVSWMWWC